MVGTSFRAPANFHWNCQGPPVESEGSEGSEAWKMGVKGCLRLTQERFSSGAGLGTTQVLAATDDLCSPSLNHNHKNLNMDSQTRKQ